MEEGFIGQTSTRRTSAPGAYSPASPRSGCSGLSVALPGQYANVSITDVELADARAIGADLALVSGSWRVHGLNQDPFTVRSTFIVRRENDRWRYVAVCLMVPFKVSERS